MSKDELLKADLLSEIVLLSSGIAILVGFFMVVALAMTHTASV